jgi:CRP/FNR family nitrogen fixation transcriptional regulator
MYVDVKSTGEAHASSGDGRYAGTKLSQSRSIPAWDDVAGDLDLRTSCFESHATIITEDDDADHVFRIRSGQVMLYRLLSDGRRQIVDLLAAGDFFGMSTTGSYDCSAEAIGAVVVDTIRQSCAPASDGLQAHLNRCLVQRVEALHSHAALLGRKSAHERVSTFIMRFVNGRGQVGCPGPKSGDAAVVVLRMTRQEIADYLGLTIETVSRVLSDMKRKGVIAIEKNDRIHIGSVCRLCKLTGVH